MKTNPLLLITIVFLTAAFHPSAKAEDTASDDVYVPKTLDGAVLEAVESYPDLGDQSLGFGLGIYPTDGYYSALLFNLTYTNRINRNLKWEVLNASYSYTYDKNLTTELAERYAVNPRSIERLEFLMSTNIAKTLAHGKFIFMDDHIRYFQAAGIFGVGLAKTNKTSNVTGNFGIKTEVFTSEKFSWYLDIRDQLSVNNFTHFLTFIVGTGVAF